MDVECLWCHYKFGKNVKQVEAYWKNITFLECGCGQDRKHCKGEKDTDLDPFFYEPENRRQGKRYVL